MTAAVVHSKVECYSCNVLQNLHSTELVWLHISRKHSYARERAYTHIMASVHGTQCTKEHEGKKAGKNVLQQKYKNTLWFQFFTMLDND